MIALFWNCRGLARPAAVRALRATIRRTNLDCLCLVETKTCQAQLFLSRIGFSSSLVSPPFGLSGGMVFGWRDGLDFDVLSITRHSINLVVFDSPGFQPWLLSFIHSPVERPRKDEFWANLSALGSRFSGSCLILGDFNMVSDQLEK